ncbi:MAG: SPFH domain-containing protein [Candidatus Dadabacteria bacterium]|nr:MAG: SPFH domain-containing protein [Candidatus Dadabacteria bacterium]
MKSLFRVSLLLIILCALSACDTGLRTMREGEVGIRFRKLPPAIGGGLAKKIVKPGQTVIVWPWDSLYRFDTKIQNISWGAKGTGSDKRHEDYVYTRAFDGNEIALAVTIRYSIEPDPEKIIRMAKEVATSNKDVRDIVVSIARADIRTYLNELTTDNILDKTERYKAVDRVRDAMNKRLNPWGIKIHQVNLDQYRFERLLPDGRIDASYQERIDEIQRVREETEREKLRQRTMKAEKQKQFNDTQAEVNRLIESAGGYKNQAVFRADGYYKAQANQAEAILAAGKAEVQGLMEQINALSGPGGPAILKLELVKQLLRNDPRFVLLEEDKSRSGLEVKRVDTNDLLNQIGIFEGLKQKTASQTGKTTVKIEKTAK